MSTEPTPDEVRDMKEKSHREFLDAAWSTILSKKIGNVDTWEKQDVGNPYHLHFHPVDTLVKGMGIPPGFEERVFYVTVNPKDSRLTEKGIDSLATRLRRAARNWLREKKLQANAKVADQYPSIEIVRNDSPWSDPCLAGKTYIMLRVRIWDQLLPPVYKANPGDGDMGSPVEEDE